MDPILDAAYFLALPIVAFEFEAIVDILVGSGQAFAGLISVLAVTIPDIFDTIYTLALWAITHLECFFKILRNLPVCIFFYVLDMLGQLIYLPIRLGLWAVLFTIGLNLYPIEKGAWDIIYKVDCFVHETAGIHIAHWPDNIIDDCYNCCRVKTQTLMNKGSKVMDDINKTAPKMLYPGINKIGRGGTKFMNPFG